MEKELLMDIVREARSKGIDVKSDDGKFSNRILSVASYTGERSYEFSKRMYANYTEKASQSRANAEKIVLEVFKTCNETIFQYAKENTYVPLSFPKHNHPLFEYGNQKFGTATYRLDYFKHLDDVVLPNMIDLPGTMGKWSEIVRSLLEDRHAKRSPFRTAIFLLTALVNLLLFALLFQLPVPDFLALDIIANPLHKWSYVLLTATAWISALSLQADEGCYTKGLFRPLCSTPAHTVLMFLGAMLLIELLAFKKLPFYLPMTHICYYLILGISVIIADIARAIPYKSACQEMQRQFCIWWKENETAVYCYLLIHKMWWYQSFPDKPYGEGVQNLEHIIYRMDTYYQELSNDRK